MKPEIYYDAEERDLYWLPKHSLVIAMVARELFDKGHHFDATIRGIGEPHSDFPYVYWACRKPEPLLNHPIIKEILAMPKTIEIPEQFVKDLHTYFPWPGREIIERHFPQLFTQKAEPTPWPKGYEKFGAFEWKGRLYFRDELAEYIDYTYGAFPGPEGYKRAGFAPLNGWGTTRLPSWVKTKEFPEESEPETNLKPGLYRDKDGVPYILCNDREGDWRLLSTGGMVGPHIDRNFFSQSREDELAALRHRLSKLTRVE